MTGSTYGQLVGGPNTALSYQKARPAGIQALAHSQSAAILIASYVRSSGVTAWYARIASHVFWTMNGWMYWPTAAGLAGLYPIFWLINHWSMWPKAWSILGTR